MSENLGEYQTALENYVQYKSLCLHFGVEVRHFGGTGVHAMDCLHFREMRVKYRKSLVPAQETKKPELHHPLVIDRVTKLARPATQDDIHRMESICSSYDAILQGFSVRLRLADELKKQIEATYGR